MDGRSPQEHTFDTDGFVRLPGALRDDDVVAMRECVWEMLAKHGTLRDDAGTWCIGGRLPLIEVSGALRPGPGTDELLWEIGRAPPFAALKAGLERAVDGVFGPGTWAMDGDQGALAAPNFPIRDLSWGVPWAAWHVDEPTASSGGGWGLLAFLFLDRVEASGGATVVIAGSQRRMAQIAVDRPGLLTTEQAMAKLGEESWFADLFAPGEPADRRRFLDEPYLSHGVALRVVELTGEPGDIVLMDPRCLHTVSANVSNRVRLTLRVTMGRVA